VAPSQRAAIALLSIGLIAACGEDRPPMPPVLDTGIRLRDTGLDSGPLDGQLPRTDAGPSLPRADHEVVLPYRGPTEEIAIVVSADAARFDIHLSIDTTGSFGEEIDTIQRELLEQVLPAIRERVADVGIGVSRFEDFALSPFGGPDDHAFELLSGITTSEDRVGAAIAALDEPLGNGGDIAESGAEALYQIATGEGLTSEGVEHVERYDRRPAPGGGALGGVGFRESSLRAVVHITDAPSHESADYLPAVTGVHSLADATEALVAMDVAVLGIASGGVARPHLERVAIDTGASIRPLSGSCPTGIDGAERPTISGFCPLVFDVARDGTGLSNAMADALVALLDSVRFDEVYGAARDDELGFVEAIEARSSTPPDGTPEPRRMDLRPTGDDVLDTFVDVRPGTELELVARLRNDRIPPADYEQVFRVTIEVLGDGLVLAEQVVRIVVPRGRLPMDAGPGDGGATDSGGGDADGGIADAGDSG